MSTHVISSMFLLFTDCGAPSATAGYTVGTYSTTDFQSTVPMNCATGYTGSAADITCQANRTWTPPSGCTIVGKFLYQCYYSMHRGFYMSAIVL